MLLELLKMYRVEDVHKILSSKGMVRFRNLKVTHPSLLMRSVSKIFDILLNSGGDSFLQLLLSSYSFYFHNASLGNPNTNQCKQNLMVKLLKHPLDFFKDETTFTRYYFFILRHLTIVATEEFLSRGIDNVTENARLRAINYTRKIENLTIKSIESTKNMNKTIYRFHILAAYLVLMLDDENFMHSNINEVRQHLIIAFHLIYNANAPYDEESIPYNLQGIRPLWDPEANFNFNSKIGYVNVIEFAQKQKQKYKGDPTSHLLLQKIFVARYILGLRPTSINIEPGFEEYIKKIVYIDKEGNITKLYDALVSNKKYYNLRTQRFVQEPTRRKWSVSWPR